MSIELNQQVESLLDALARDTGATGLALDAAGQARIEFDDGRLKVDFEWDAIAEVLHVHSSPALMPTDGREAVCMRLVRLNLLGQSTGGGNLGWDIVTDELVLSMQIYPRTDSYEAFRWRLERFVESLRQLPGLLQQNAPHDEGPRATGPTLGWA